MNNRLHALAFSRFFWLVFSICFGYLVFEFLFIPYGALVTDEFVFARHIYEYTFHLPYRDFPPYKTVLGYYLYSLPFFFSHGLFAPIFYIKKEIALINTILIALSCGFAARFFDKKAIILSMLTMLANLLFLMYGSELRVDMLSSWACLFAILCVLDNRWRSGGLLLGMGFLISQKAIWYVFAINGALLFGWLILRHSRYSLRAFFNFNVASLLPILFYIFIWSSLASPSVVLHNVFYDAFIQARIDYYLPIYWICMSTIFHDGPMVFLLFPFTFLSLYDKNSNPSVASQRIFILAVATIVLLLLLSYQQPFPYNFVFIFPAFFLLYSEFFSWIFHETRNQVAFLNAFLLIFVIIGLLYPFYETLKISKDLNGNYQRTMIELTSQLLQKEGDYVGGIPFLYQKDQPINGMKNLITPAIAYLYAPESKLEPLMLPSLYLSAVTSDDVIREFEVKPVKVIINDNRMSILPPNIALYIAKNYQHFYGSIYLYSPTISPTQLSFHLKFTGDYRVIGKRKTSLSIDNHRVLAGTTIHLQTGDHVVESRYVFRLALIPSIDKTQLNPNFSEDNWRRMVKTIII